MKLATSMRWLIILAVHLSWLIPGLRGVPQGRGWIRACFGRREPEPTIIRPESLAPAAPPRVRPDGPNPAINEPDCRSNQSPSFTSGQVITNPPIPSGPALELVTKESLAVPDGRSSLADSLLEMAEKNNRKKPSETKQSIYPVVDSSNPEIHSGLEAPHQSHEYHPVVTSSPVSYTQMSQASKMPMDGRPHAYPQGASSTSIPTPEKMGNVHGSQNIDSHIPYSNSNHPIQLKYPRQAAPMIETQTNIGQSFGLLPSGLQQQPGSHAFQALGAQTYAPTHLNQAQHPHRLAPTIHYPSHMGPHVGPHSGYVPHPGTNGAVQAQNHQSTGGSYAAQLLHNQNFVVPRLSEGQQQIPR